MNILNEITNEEFDKLVKVLADRIKNVVFMHAEERARVVLTDLKNESNLSIIDSLTVTYTINFLVNDAFEIIGGFRRKNEKI